ncbi:hypothetical protein JYK14_01200 [Siccirubricoccus sp. KC 17139]|uniref:Helicase/UvrB N-terminal domain-containing protein n=1 Tax=Siccirubricoccus soli TaxID=2899147 RepID=A0ABT1CZF9_9PROT|nr:hypothetical protein [Siccirubricoccus soli]MCO6414797.1 hypothetical protein [Siccirubricoccus soli]MCP2680927.1 hypothetical protein [Siccirubricoccus soli]
MNSKFEKQPVQSDLSWHDFVELMRSYSTQVRTTQEKESSDNVAAIINATFKADATSKSLSQVESGTDWMAFDLDDLTLSDQARIKQTLAGLNNHYLMWSTTKHQATQPRLRVVLPFDRILTIEEHAKLWHLFNHIFDGLVDSKTHNINRLHYVPYAWADSNQHLFIDHSEGAETLPADQMLSWADQLIDSGVIRVTPQVDDAAVDELRASLHNTALSWNGYRDCPFVDQDMLEEYRNAPEGGRFYHFMTRIAVRSINQSYPIQAGELASLALELDREITGKERKSAASEARNALLWAQRVCITNPSEMSALLETYHTGLEFSYIEADCGEGKTRYGLSQVLQHGGVWVWSTPKISDMQKRIADMRELSPSGLKALNLHTVKHQQGSDQDEEALTVVEQLKRVREKIRENPSQPHCVFVTHAACKLMDWSDWADLDATVIEDEVRDVLMTRTPNFSKNFDKVGPLFDVVETESGCYRLRPSKQAETDLAENRFDDLDRKLKYLIMQADSESNEMWVTRDSWDAKGAKALEFVIINKPHNLRHFKRVIFMGDHFSRSPFKRIWSHKYGVKWTPVADWKPTRRRLKPLAQRVRIHCFSKGKQASLSWFSDPSKTPLPAITSWLKARYPGAENPIIWSTNDAHLSQVDLERHGADGKGVRKDKQLTPRSHGENEHQHHKVCWWASAMRLGDGEAKLVKRTLGIDKKVMEEWRAHNAMHQFFMRGNARDYNSLDSVDMFCVDMHQARYQAARFGISECDIIYHEGVIDDVEDKGGRPLAADNPFGRPMTNTEYSRRHRERLAAEREAAGIPKRPRGRPAKAKPEAEVSV